MIMKIPIELLAHALAANERDRQDGGMKKLKDWLAARLSKDTSFSKDQMMKSWKGLFYCMRLSDKPVLQEDLADNISQLVHSFNNVDASFLFVECFFKSMIIEWAGLDPRRMDKCLMFTEKFLVQCFALVEKLDSNYDVLDRFLDILIKARRYQKKVNKQARQQVKNLHEMADHCPLDVVPENLNKDCHEEMEKRANTAVKDLYKFEKTAIKSRSAKTVNESGEPEVIKDKLMLRLLKREAAEKKKEKKNKKRKLVEVAVRDESSITPHNNKKLKKTVSWADRVVTATTSSTIQDNASSPGA